ncbi:MAG: dipeptidase E [Thermoproteota archaeon]|jgi:dipeptidase E
MKLVFYGGGDAEDNFELDKILLNLSEKKNPQITFIPSCSYDSEEDYVDFVKQYAKHKIHKIIKYPVEYGDPILKHEVFKSDIIHLSGGNTYGFLESLKKKDLFGELKAFVKHGGIITGLSAGGIIMTPAIDTAGFPRFDKDDNNSKLKSLKSLSLVKFYFFPHYKNSKRYDEDLLAYSKKVELPVYAVPDGAGIIVDGENLTFHNKVYCFYQNKKIALK